MVFLKKKNIDGDQGSLPLQDFPPIFAYRQDQHNTLQYNKCGAWTEGVNPQAHWAPGRDPPKEKGEEAERGDQKWLGALR